MIKLHTPPWLSALNTSCSAVKTLSTAVILGCGLSLLSASASAKLQTPPKEGAYETQQYRNLFAEMGKRDSHIQQRVKLAFAKMFYGNEDERLFYDFDRDESYIKTVDTDDIRSEGMSWGMMIAVQMDRLAEFNHLWRFAYQRMRNEDGSYAWQVKQEGDTIKIMDTTSAPDGEEYIVTALLMAAERWGNGEGIFNYRAQANELLDLIKNKLLHPKMQQVVFAPVGDAGELTDPSYHLPAFYDYWADLAEKDGDFWRKTAQISRQFLRNHINPKTGLASYLANFDGTPSKGLPYLGNPGNVYEGDAWRVAMNIGMDAHFFGAEQWHSEAVDTLQKFLGRKNGLKRGGVCGKGYSQKYFIDGRSYGNCDKDNWTHWSGQQATNAVASLAATKKRVAKKYLDALWSAPWPTGKYRYYHGCLQMLGLLHASGNFKLYKAPRQPKPLTAAK